MDFKKEDKELYAPKTEPSFMEVPEMLFLMVDGIGNPNDPEGEYQKAVELLYALSYGIKMSKKGADAPAGYFEYVVAPLEGLWWLADEKSMDFSEKEKYCWTSMIRQPEFVTEEFFKKICENVKKKKPELEIEKVRLARFKEGPCVHAMHIGPFETEKETIEKIDAFMKAKGLENGVGQLRADGSIKRHHEIYLSDPRKLSPEKRKTILRYPIAE